MILTTVPPLSGLSALGVKCLGLFVVLNLTKQMPGLCFYIFQSEAFLKDNSNGAQRVLDGVNAVIQSVTEYSTGPTKAITTWLTDQVAPDYWRSNSEITVSETPSNTNMSDRVIPISLGFCDVGGGGEGGLGAREAKRKWCPTQQTWLSSSFPPRRQILADAPSASLRECRTVRGSALRECPTVRGSVLRECRTVKRDSTEGVPHCQRVSAEGVPHCQRDSTEGVPHCQRDSTEGVPHCLN